MPAKFELKKAKDGQFHFSLKASNGEVILSSELYKTKRSALAGIASAQKNSPEAARYETKESKNGKPYFVLKAANHQVIGQSELYESAAACANGIKSVQKNGGAEKIEEIA